MVNKSRSSATLSGAIDQDVRLTLAFTTQAMQDHMKREAAVELCSGLDTNGPE